MDVLMVAPAGTGGIYAYTDALCRGLCEIGADVAVLTNPLWPDLPAPYTVERCMFEITAKKSEWSQLYWAVDRVWRCLGNSLRRNRFAIRKCPDVVHMQLGVPLIDQLLLKPLARHLPVVLTVHDVRPHSEQFVSNRSFLKRYFHIPHRLIVHYEDGKRQLVDGCGVCADRIDVIPHGIMPLLNRPSLSDAREKLNLPLDREIMLFFGAIRANKGLDVLLKALEIVRLHRPRILLVIAGVLPRGVSFEPYSNIIKRADLSQYVRMFIRFIAEDEIDHFFAASNLVVLPYLKFEAQSGVLLRAYAHKKPMVVSNVGAMGEVVSSDNIGMVVEPGEPKSLAKAIISVSSDFDRFESCYSPELKSKYSWKHIAGLTMRSYEAAIGNRDSN